LTPKAFGVDDLPDAAKLHPVANVMKTILFVCTGNVCRSPMAEGLIRRAVQNRGNYRALSAGLGAADGQPPSAFAVQDRKSVV
jgi:glycine hydroxymethyltransferase